MTNTTNLKLNKPGADDFYNIEEQNGNMDIIDEAIQELSSSKAEKTAVEELKKSVSDGKTLVANAITEKGVVTETDATFSKMATNIASIEVGIDTSIATATTSDILVGKTAGVGGAIITGKMANNGAISQTLGINGTYTIPQGYHNGSGKVTQSITTKGAATYTPGDSAQTIANGQYLSGVQTIVAVPTETKTVTAGTTATTVSRTSGKYMTSVTVNPTPSQTKTVTLTSSPLTITPDSGKLLSSVTVSANLGKRYASGTSYTASPTSTTYYYYIRAIGQVQSRSDLVPLVTLNLGFTPRIFKATFYTLETSKHEVLYNIGLDYGVAHTRDSFYLWWYTSPQSTTTEIWVPVIGSGYSTVSNLTWEVWE